MNDQQIEQLLRQTPAPLPPPGLKEQLKTGIRLAAPPPERVATGAPFWRRWYPALSFGVLLLGCLVALAVQTSQLRDLHRENASLRAATASVGRTPGARHGGSWSHASLRSIDGAATPPRGGGLP